MTQTEIAHSVQIDFSRLKRWFRGYQSKGPNMQDAFVEQLGNMVVGAGVVRLDFMRIEAAEAGKTGHLQPGLRVVMPLAAFAQAVDAMNTLRDKLVADGAVVRNAMGDASSVKS